MSAYESLSHGQRQIIEMLLPPDWDWRGKRVLDFGCGAGRTLRQFHDVAESAEFWGCDIHGPSIDWLRGNLCPPFRAWQGSEFPKLPQPDGYFDLIYAMSVYTHITDAWAGWLLEHRRALSNDGLMIVSFLGEGMIGELLDERWDDQLVGMNVSRVGASFDESGPMVFHSPWWLRAHWGRAFDIVQLLPHAGSERPEGHGVIVLRPNDAEVSVEDLERPEPGEARELTALQHQVRQLSREAWQVWRERDQLLHSSSWRLTRPFRKVAHAARARTGRAG